MILSQLLLLPFSSVGCASAFLLTVENEGEVNPFIETKEKSHWLFGKYQHQRKSKRHIPHHGLKSL